jgi:hypothetical protein
MDDGIKASRLQSSQYLRIGQVTRDALRSTGVGGLAIQRNNLVMSL